MEILKVLEKSLRNKNYSERTIQMYIHYALKFISDIKYTDPYQIPTKDGVRYLYEYRYSSISQQNQIINAIKAFYKYCLNKSDIHLNKIERPRREKHLPKVIDKVTLLDKIKNIPNLKHKAILMTAYSGGLRVSEIINLKVTDIDSARMLIHINNAKGRKDRIVKLSDDVLNTLREYYRAYRPKNYMFEGQFSEQYSAGSCNEIYKKYIDKNTSFHALRHSCFTAMLEGGVDLRIIQKIAGHASSNTTEIYTHVSNNVIQNVYTPI